MLLKGKNMKKIFLVAFLFLFIFSCGTDTEKTDEKEIKERKEKKELNFKICLALNPKIESQLGLVTNVTCNADEDESLETQNESIRKVEELLKNKELIKENEILKKHFEEMKNLVKSEGETIFFKNFALLKENENMSEIENFISDYKTFKDWERTKLGWTWKEKFEALKKEYEIILGKKFISFKEAKSEVISIIKNKTFENKKKFCELRKETEPVAQKIDNGNKFYFVFQEDEFYFINNVGKTLSDASGSEIADFLCGKQK